MLVTWNNEFLALVGPTCVGKTKYALEILEHFPLELINLDSFQVYSFFEIGNGRYDLRSGRAHLYGFRDPLNVLSAEEYLSLVDGAIGEIVSKGCYPLFEGGSISYIKAILQRCKLRIIGFKPVDDAHAMQLIEERITSTPEELLIAEIREGIRRGYQDTIVMRDDVVYLPYVEYLRGRSSLEETRRRVRKNLFKRYEAQMEEYGAMPVEWYIPSDDGAGKMLITVRRFLDGQI